MIPNRRLFAVAVVLLSTCPAAQNAQPPTQKPEQIPMITTTTRLVLVDVIATDGKGHPATDLQASDFVVQENGKPQKIASFVRMPESDKPPVVPPPPLPPDVFTNDPRYHTISAPPMIVLLDLLNTPTADRPRVRLAMIDFLQKRLRPGQPTTVFLLGSKLELLQDFTSDPRILLFAMDRVKGNPRSAEADHAQSDMIKEMMSRASDPVILGILEKALEIAKRFESAFEIAATTDRADKLLQATSTIARAAQGIPGRKSMVWVTAGLPVLVKNQSVASYYPTSQEIVSFTDLLGHIADSLRDAQIAIYPVDIRGLNTTAPLWADTTLYTNRRDGTRSRNNSPVTSEQTAALETTQESLVRMAEQTGGRAFLNRNDGDAAIATAADDGQHYYTIGYYPEDKRWNGKFRKIQLKVAREGLQLRHRTGYFAEDPASWQRRADRELTDALQLDPVVTAQVIFSGRAPKPAPGQPVNVEFLLPPASMHLEQQNGLYVGSMDFHVAAITDEDKAVLTAGKTSNFSLDPEKYRQLMTIPSLTTSVPLNLAPGRYRIRLLLRDNLIGKLGTLEIPLTVPKK